MGSRSRVLLVMAFATFTFATFAAHAAKLLEHIPLQWRPTSSLQFGTQQVTPSPVQFATFKDVRPKPELIGENREDDLKPPKPVTTSEDVGAFVSAHIRDLFKQAGLNTVDSNGSVIVKGEVTQFFVTETNTYEAQVAVHLSVESPAGATLWSGVASGDAKRFGRSYKAENYYEVLSDATVNAVSSMLQSSEFQRALAARSK
jgi:hypothetical protein